MAPQKFEQLPEKPLAMAVRKEDDGRIVFSSEGKVFLHLLSPVIPAVDDSISKILGESARDTRNRIDISNLKLGDVKGLKASVKEIEDKLSDSEVTVERLKVFISARLKEEQSVGQKALDYVFWNGMLSATAHGELALVISAKSSGRKITYSRVDGASSPERSMYYTDADAGYFISVLKASYAKEKAPIYAA